MRENKNQGKKFWIAVMAACMMAVMSIAALAQDETAAADTERSADLPEVLEKAVEPAPETETQIGENTYNLLLIGVDRRTDSWNGNSDVMILVTVNPDKETIFLTSFLRDLYADIPGIGVRKLNAACASGGAGLCVETIRSNYQVRIDNYALVDFDNMIHIVDVFGGVELELTESEVRVANQYVETMCAANGEPYENHRITGSGLLHLDGYQAVGYMRNRYSGNENDFGRTDRQRKVLGALLEKMKDCDMENISSLLLEVLPNMEHDVSGLEMLSLVTKLPDWLKYDFEEQRIPYEGLYHSENEILVPDMEETLERLQGTLYSQE